ncbi:MAG: choice-of-anchor D domain-containing protein [Terriglobia bacterium]
MTDNASNSPQSVSLTGSVEAMPFPTLSPTSLSFGQENDGTATPAQTVTLANAGSALLSISSIGTQGANFFDYVQTNNCGASLAAGTNCAINVQFKPASYGYTSIASLAVADNASGSPQTASLTGTGLPPATPAGSFWVTIQAEGEGGSGAEFQEWFHNVQLTVNVQ